MKHTQQLTLFCFCFLTLAGVFQDTLGGRFDASQALVGELSQFNLWDRLLSPAEVSNLASCSGAGKLGNVSLWTSRDVDVFGGASKEPVDPCARRSGALQ